MMSRARSQSPYWWEVGASFEEVLDNPPMVQEHSFALTWRTVEAYRWPSGVASFDETEAQRETIIKKNWLLGRTVVRHSIILAEGLGNQERRRRLHVDISRCRIDSVSQQLVTLDAPGSYFDMDTTAEQMREDRRLGLSVPTEADYTLLLEELRRGVAFRRLEGGIEG
jgi:hypothetical protein